MKHPGQIASLASSLACVLALLGAAAGPFPPLLEHDLARLRAGEVIVSAVEQGDGIYEFFVSALYEESPEIVWEVVRDCGSFHEFMPRALASSMSEAPDGSQVCDMKTDLPLPLPDVESSARSLAMARGDGSFQRQFRQIQSSLFELNEGAWWVTPFDAAGKQTLLRYRLLLKPTLPVPEFILLRAQTEQAPAAFAAIGARARAIGTPQTP